MESGIQVGPRLSDGATCPRGQRGHKLHPGRFLDQPTAVRTMFRETTAALDESHRQWTRVMYERVAFPQGLLPRRRRGESAHRARSTGRDPPAGGRGEGPLPGRRRRAGKVRVPANSHVSRWPQRIGIRDS